MRDKRIEIVFKLVALVLILTCIVYFILNPTTLYILFLWVFFFTALAIYRYYIYRKVYDNFNAILKQSKRGNIRKGHYFFAVPHAVKFLYQDKICQIGHSIDWKLDHMIEYSFSIDKEIEIVIIRQKNKDAGKENFTIVGADKDSIGALLNEPQIKNTVKKMISDFSYIYIGKDSQIRLLEPYNRHLTSPKKVFSTIDRMIELVNFLEQKISE